MDLTCELCYNIPGDAVSLRCLATSKLGATEQVLTENLHSWVRAGTKCSLTLFVQVNNDPSEKIIYMVDKITIVERDDTGRVFTVAVTSAAGPHVHDARTSRGFKLFYSSLSHRGLGSIRHVLSDVFLPAGYPASVSPDYLPYQIYNALQAFCSSVSGLLASRGALEGVGVGDASVSATQALLLTVLKDVFSRLTTIIAAYYFGTSLYPETKMFRFLADVVNDASIVLDTLVPYIGAINLSESLPFIPSGPNLQTITLCISGGLRSLCGLIAGGSKAALTNHFASPSNGKGDVGELNAKDASRETVIGLLGMLLGTLLVPYIDTRTSTYMSLFILVVGHLVFNYLGVRAVILRTLNRQRAAILWSSFSDASGTIKNGVLSPSDVASRELILCMPNCLRCSRTGRITGRCILGTSMRTVASCCSAHHIKVALRIFAKEKYILFISERSGWSVWRSPQSTIYVCFKDGYTPLHQLQAWVHSMEVATKLTGEHGVLGHDTMADILQETHLAIQKAVPQFIRCLMDGGWGTGEDSMMFGSPSSVVLSNPDDAGDDDGELKKQR